MNAITFTPRAAFAGRTARNNVRARLGTAHGSAPVRRDSSSPQDPTRFMPYGERRHLMRVLRTYATETRGKRGASMVSASALHVAETMLFLLMDRATGRLEHAYTWIASHSRRAYQTAISAVRQLKALEVLVVVRRCRPGESGEGPSWVQDTNLYGFRLPGWLQAWWGAREARRKEAREARERERCPDDADWAAEQHRRRASATDTYQEDLARVEIAEGLKLLAQRLGVPLEEEEEAEGADVPAPF